MSIGDGVALHRYKYVALLVLALTGLAVQSFDAQPGSEDLLSDLFQTALSVGILVVVFERHRARIAMGVILIAIIAIGWVRHFLLTPDLNYALSLSLYALMALYFWTAVWVILSDLFRTRGDGAKNVLGAICGYLIAGEAWAAVNAFTYLLVPTAYGVSSDVDALLADWHGRLALFSYYSYAQMLSIGYADVTPVRAPATTLSLFGALFGTFYTAVVVSQFVGMAQVKER